MAWKPVQITRQFTFEGGYQAKALSLETREIVTRDGEMTFVKIDKGAEWLNRAACGKKAHKGSLRRSEVFDQLKTKLKNKVKDVSTPSSEPAVAGSIEDDPMNALEEIGDNALETPKKSRDTLTNRSEDRARLLLSRCLNLNPLATQPR